MSGELDLDRQGNARYRSEPNIWLILAIIVVMLLVSVAFVGFAIWIRRFCCNGHQPVPQQPENA